jgi:putative sigma-54 modulation protein
MNISIEAVGFSASDALADHITRKASVFSRTFDRIERCKVLLKSERASDNRSNVVEIELKVPGTSLFGSSSEDSFEKASDEAIDQLRLQLIRYKEKMRGD